MPPAARSPRSPNPARPPAPPPQGGLGPPPPPPPKKPNPSPSTAPAAPTTTARRVQRVLVVGDSVALTLGRGIERWGARHGVVVWNAGALGCALVDGAL